MKTIPVFSLLVFMSFSAISQDVVLYDYDFNGNRTSKYELKLTEKINELQDSVTVIYKLAIVDSLTMNIPHNLEQVTVTLYPNPNGGQFKVMLTN